MGQALVQIRVRTLTKYRIFVVASIALKLCMKLEGSVNYLKTKFYCIVCSEVATIHTKVSKLGQPLVIGANFLMKYRNYIINVLKLRLGVTVDDVVDFPNSYTTFESEVVCCDTY